MVKLPTIRKCICAAACLAMVCAVTSIAWAQQEEHNLGQQQPTTDQYERERDSQSNQQDSDSDQQARERDQQPRQDDEQRQQQGQQSQQRDQASQPWDQQQRERTQQTQSDESRTREPSQRQSSSWPQPTRYEYGRQQQTQYESSAEGQASRFTPSAGQQAGLGVIIVNDGGPGVVVTQVYRGSPADEMGIQPNDRITHINGQQIWSDQEFISTIRNMDPGDEVELEVLRDRDARIVRGELESRQEALVLSNRRQGGQIWQQGDENWQTGYQEQGGYGFQQQGRTSRGGEFNSRLNSLEQQVSRLSRELEQVRFALQDLRQGGPTGQISRSQRSGETQAGYDEYQSGRFQDGRTTTRFRDSQSNRFGEFRGQGTRPGEAFRDTQQGSSFRSTDPSRESGGRSGDSRPDTESGSQSEGGVTGGLRTRPQNDQDWSDRQ